MAEENEKSDDDIFSEFLDKVGPTWLEKQIAKILEENPERLHGTTGSKSKAQTVEGLEGYLNRALEKAEARGENLRETLDEAMAMLTPDQLSTLRKSRRKPDADDQNLQTRKKPNEPQSENETPAPKKSAGLAGLLKRL